MAWARLGVLKLNTGAVSEAAEYFTRAYQLSDNVSEREKLYIAGHYYSTVVGDLNKSIETLQVATQEYPLRRSTTSSISVSLYLSNGDIEKSDAANRRALELQPDNAIALENGVAASDPTGSTRGSEQVYCGSETSRLERHFSAGDGELRFTRRSLTGTTCRKTWQRPPDVPTNSPLPRIGDFYFPN